MPKSHDRADDKTTMTVSLPKVLLEKIDAFAKEDRRPRSNWVVHELEGIVARKLADKEAISRVDAAHIVRPHSDSTRVHSLNEQQPDRREVAPPSSVPRMTKTRAKLRAIAQQHKPEKPQ